MSLRWAQSITDERGSSNSQPHCRDAEQAYLDVLGQLEAGELEMGRGPPGQVDEQQPVDVLLVLVEHHHVREAPRARILHNLLDGRALHKQTGSIPQSAGLTGQSQSLSESSALAPG